MCLHHYILYIHYYIMYIHNCILCMHHNILHPHDYLFPVAYFVIVFIEILVSIYSFVR